MKATMRMSTTSRTVIWRRSVRTLAITARLPGPEDGLGRADGAGDRPDVVDPQDVRAALDRKGGGGDRRFEPLAGRLAGDLPQERLARETDEQGTAELLEDLLAPQDLEVVLEGLAEAD